MQVLGKISQKLVTYEVPLSGQEKEDAVRSGIVRTCHKFAVEWHTSRPSALSSYTRPQGYLARKWE